MLAHTISANLQKDPEEIAASKGKIRRSPLKPEPFSAEGEHVFYTHATGIH